jgi:hypothetical protein
MDTASKLQDPRATARWHNIWLGTALFFLVSTVTFSGLFGWAFTQWKEDDTCHEYHANLVHLPPGNFTPMTTLLFHDGEVHFRKGAAYDASSCEGKLVNQLIKKGNVIDMETSGGRRLQTGTLIRIPGATFRSYPVKGCSCSSFFSFPASGWKSVNDDTICTGTYFAEGNSPGIHCGKQPGGFEPLTIRCRGGGPFSPATLEWKAIQGAEKWHRCQRKPRTA